MEAEWDLFRRGQLDQERHLDKIRKAIEENLGDLIGDASVMDGEGRVKVRLRALREHRFRYADGEGEGIGSGRPGTRKGDVVGRIPEKGESDAGDEHDEGTYEVWVNADAVAAQLFADLELPNIRPKAKTIVSEPDPIYKDIRRQGPMSLLDLRHTIRANLIKNGIRGKPGFYGITEDDLRYKAMELEQTTKDQCVVIFIRDRSGSMGDWEKELTRLGAFWTLTFLRQKYRDQVQPVYILHDTQAEVVAEKPFFEHTEGGGTAISCSYRLTQELIETQYPPDSWNIYVVQFTDGDNLSSDNERCVDLLKQLAPSLNLLAYWEIGADSKSPAYYRSATFGNFLAKEMSHIPVIERVTLQDKADVVAAVRHFFRKRGGEPA